MSKEKPKLKLAVYWGAACGGCCVSVLDVHEKLFDVVAAADLVFWPIALDTKYELVSKKSFLGYNINENLNLKYSIVGILYRMP